MNKRGSHVGVVISFVIFVTFLVFLYTIISSLSVKEREKEYMVDYLIANLMNSSSETISTLVLNVNQPTGNNRYCINIQSIDIEQIPVEYRDNLLFKYGDQALSYKLQNINTIWVKIPQEHFQGIILVQFSESITPNMDETMSGCDPHPYPMGDIKEITNIFESMLYELAEMHETNYEEFKEFLGLSPDLDFNFYVLNAEREIVISAVHAEPPRSESVYVEEVPLQYVDEEGNIHFGFLKVEIW